MVERKFWRHAEMFADGHKGYAIQKHSYSEGPDVNSTICLGISSTAVRKDHKSGWMSMFHFNGRYFPTFNEAVAAHDEALRIAAVIRKGGTDDQT